MALFDFLGGIVKPVTDLIGDLSTSDKERLQAANDLARIEAGIIGGQLEINKTEAAHSSVFVAGWRPAIGWVGAAALAYQFILYPLLTWVWAAFAIDRPPPIPLDTSMLWTIITGMLGIGGLRSFDKYQGTDTKQVGGK